MDEANEAFGILAGWSRCRYCRRRHQPYEIKLAKHTIPMVGTCASCLYEQVAKWSPNSYFPRDELLDQLEDKR